MRGPPQQQTILKIPFRDLPLLCSSTEASQETRSNAQKKGKLHKLHGNSSTPLHVRSGLVQSCSRHPPPHPTHSKVKNLMKQKKPRPEVFHSQPQKKLVN